uniref:hypothetical protein n=1 Tax=uncultured Pigmentiphaga sp. TaxID=340361 RepID=UPI00262A11BA
MCGKTGLSTVEGDGGSECQLSDGRWTCSFECWERATERAALTARAEAAEADARRWRALRDFPGVCMTLSRNEDHTPNYMTAAEWIERGMNSEDFEDVEAAEIERMKETDTIWRFQVYPDTPVGFYVWYGATADYVLDAALQGIDRDAN